jgi:hypothetical protein
VAGYAEVLDVGEVVMPTGPLGSLTPPPILKLGLLPFLIVRYLLGSSRRVATSSLRRTSLQEFPLPPPRGVHVLWEVLVRLP